MQGLAASRLSVANLTLSLFLFLCIIFELLYYIFFTGFGKKNSKNGKMATNWRQILSFFLIVSSIFFIAYSLMLFTSFLFRTADPVKTADFSKLFLSWDRAIFKTDPGIWLINQFGGTFIENILCWTYINIFEMLSLIFLVTFFLNKKAFRKLILSFFISWIIALPLWFLFPALSPATMFQLNKMNLAGLNEIRAFNNFNPSSRLKEDLAFEEKIYPVDLNPDNRILPISTFPSMHAAWGTIIAYSGIVLCPWLGIILIPLSIINDVSAVYILEHFSSDVFLGVVIALISILITEILLYFENKYFEDKFGLLSGFDYIRSIIKKI